MGKIDENFNEHVILKAYDNSQNMIILADSKANLSITLQSLLITIGLGSSLLANLIGRIWHYNLVWFWIYSSIIVIFIITSMIGIVFSILVYKARFPADKSERRRSGFLYHEHIASYNSSTEYFDKVTNNTKDDILVDFAKQTHCVAIIASKKMKFVNFSIWFLLVNIILAIILLTISGYLLILI